MMTTARMINYTGPEQPAADLADQEIAFLFARTSRDFNLEWLHGHPKLLNHLIAAVAREPKNLLAHMQRIYFCYQQNLPEHLYGAVADLFIALNRRCMRFSSRILSAISSRLSEEHLSLLRRYLLKKDFPPQYLPANTHMVLGKGIIGTLRLVKKQHEAPKYDADHDPLLLARDHIEYSQFDAAKEVLEQAILEEPEREELHSDLLELYKSLKDSDGFIRMYQRLADTDNPFADRWEALKIYFNKK